MIWYLNTGLDLETLGKDEDPIVKLAGELAHQSVLNLRRDLDKLNAE